MIMNRLVLGIIIVFALAPPAFAGVVIGADRIITVNSVSFLQLPDNPEYAQVFNFFVTIELLTGIIGAFLRMVIRGFRDE